MRNEIVRRNIILVVTTLLLFLILSITVSSYYNRKNLEINLINITEILNGQIINSESEEELRNVVNQYTKSHNWLRVSIFNSYGNIIIDSHTDDKSLSLDSEQLNKIKSLSPKPYVKTSEVLNEEMLYYGRVLNDDIIVRTAVPLTDNTGLMLNGIFFMLILIIFAVIFSVIYTKKTTDNVLNAFSLIIASLKKINEGKYAPITSIHKYEEVDEVLTEINDINSKISNSFIEIVKERDKVNFILENVNQGIFIIDYTGNILILNGKVRDIFGIEEHKPIYHLEDCDEIKDIKPAIKKAFTTNHSSSFDYKNNRDERIYSINVSNFNKEWFYDESKFSGVVVIINDVTEERKNDEMKDEFIANASHELKTPITSISGFSELIASGMIQDQNLVKDYIHRIYLETTRMKSTLDDLLSLSALDSNKYEQDLVKTNLKDIVEDIKESFSYILEKSAVTMKLKITDAYILANPKLINHLIGNLVDNAIKYNRPNGEVFISLKKQQHNVIMTVEDTGIGIEKKHVENIFSRFYRVDTSRSRLTGGSGLGLTIVKKICLLYGATIHVDSQVNVGTKITISFQGIE